MKTPNQTGTNRTGIKTSPLDSRATQEGADKGMPSSVGGESLIADVRVEVARASDPVGSMPPPASIKGVAKAVGKILKGESPNLFLNLLGERLAFERTGVRLYESVIDKLPAYAADGGGMPGLAALRSMQEEELRHVDVVRRAIESLGGDPTAMTPAADLTGVASSGVLHVATDPRAQVADSLHALLVAELVDNDGWELLIQVARGRGQNELVAEFTRCSDEEHVHLTRVRAWLSALVLREAGVDTGVAGTQPPATA